MNKKNLIIIMIDGGRYDRAINSSLFKKLEANSIFFSNSITYGPHTIAAMHAVFSGSYGTRTGTNSYWSTFKFKKDEFKTLTEYFKNMNFVTHADVINKLVIPKQGFDNFIIHDEINDNLTSRHIELLEKINRSFLDGKNYFLYLHYSKIHTGIMNEVLKIYNNYSEEYFSNKKKNESRYDELFCNAEMYLDKILEKIYSLEIDKNSIILIMSDHGISIGEKIGERAYGAFCYDYTLKTFTYFLIPGFMAKNITQQVRTIDFLPTILELFEIPIDENFKKIDGRSLVPIINGEKIDEDFAFSETGNPQNDSAPPKEPNVKSIRTSEWKLIFNEYNDTKELYNLSVDPDENNNLIGKNENMEQVLWEKLKQVSEKTS